MVFLCHKILNFIALIKTHSRPPSKHVWAFLDERRSGSHNIHTQSKDFLALLLYVIVVGLLTQAYLNSPVVAATVVATADLLKVDGRHDE